MDSLAYAKLKIKMVDNSLTTKELGCYITTSFWNKVIN